MIRRIWETHNFRIFWCAILVGFEISFSMAGIEQPLFRNITLDINQRINAYSPVFMLDLNNYVVENKISWHGPLEIAADCTIKNGTIRNNSLTGDALVTITGGNVIFEDVTFDCSGCSPHALIRIAFGSKANVTFKGNCRFLAANKNIDAIYVDYCTSGKVTFDDSFTGYVGGKITLAYEPTHPADDPAVDITIAGNGLFENTVALDGGLYEFANSSISIVGGRFLQTPDPDCIHEKSNMELDANGYWAVAPKAYSVGDVAYWANTNTTAAVWSGTAIAESNMDFCIPGCEELPVGAKVRIRKIAFASLNATYTPWDVTTNMSDPTYLRLNGVNSDIVALGGKIASNAETEDNLLEYVFSTPCEVVVGKVYPAATGNSTGITGNGIALLHENGSLLYGSNADRASVRYVNTGDPLSVVATATAGVQIGASGYFPVYAIEAEVVALEPSALDSVACDYTATMDDHTIKPILGGWFATDTAFDNGLTYLDGLRIGPSDNLAYALQTTADHLPYYNLAARTNEFSVALYADISSMPESSRAVIISFGNKMSNSLTLFREGDFVKCAFFNSSGLIIGEVASVEAKIGYHLYNITCNPLTGEFSLCLDDSDCSVATAGTPVTLGSGFQIGSIFFGRHNGFVAGENMAIAKLLGYDAELAQVDMQALSATYPAVEEIQRELLPFSASNIAVTVKPGQTVCIDPAATNSNNLFVDGGTVMVRVSFSQDCNGYTASFAKVTNGGQVIFIAEDGSTISPDRVAVNENNGISTYTLMPRAIAWDIDADGVLNSVDLNGMEEVSIPNGVIRIADYAFKDCVELTSIKIPSSVTTIGAGAFSGCTQLTQVVFDGNAPTVAADAFEQIGSACTAYVRATSSGWEADGVGVWRGLRIVGVRYGIGDVVRLSNANTTQAVWDGEAINECNIDFKIEATDDLPEGTKLRIKKIAFASLNSAFVSFDTNTNKSDPYYIKLNGVDSDLVNGAVSASSVALEGTRIQSNFMTSDFALTYGFSSSCTIVVGRSYPAVSGNAVGGEGDGIAFLWSNKNLVYGSGADRASVRYVRTGETGSAMETQTAAVITGETCYCPVYEIEAEIVSLPYPIAEWSGDFSADALNKFSGCTLVDWQATHGENAASVTIDRDNQGLMLNANVGMEGLTILVRYSGLASGDNKSRVLFTSSVNSEHKFDRTGIQLLPNGKLLGLWNSSTISSYDNDYGSASGTIAASGVMAFTYSTEGTYLYYGKTCEDISSVPVWGDSSLKSNSDTAIYGAGIGGMYLNSTKQGTEAAKGMTIDAITVFDHVISVDVMRACTWANKQSTPGIEINTEKMEEPVETEEGVKTIAAKENETLSQADADAITISVTVGSEMVYTTAGYNKTYDPVLNQIVITLKEPEVGLAATQIEAEKVEGDATGMLADLEDANVTLSTPEPEPTAEETASGNTEVGALPVKTVKGLYYQAHWGNDLGGMRSGDKVQATGDKLYLGVIKQTGTQGFYKVTVSEQ